MNTWEAAELELRQFARRQNLRILVWGPGNPGANADATLQLRYQKRVQIKENLQNTFTSSDVRFSEDPLLQQMTNYEPRQLRREAIHARLAHVVIMLDTGRGVDLELDHFVPTYPWFRDKVYVFLPVQYVNTTGLVSDVLALIPLSQIEGFTDADIQSCLVASERVIRILDSVAVNFLLSSKAP